MKISIIYWKVTLLCLIGSTNLLAQNNKILNDTSYLDDAEARLNEVIDEEYHTQRMSEIIKETVAYFDRLSLMNLEDDKKITNQVNDLKKTIAIKSTPGTNFPDDLINRAKQRQLDFLLSYNVSELSADPVKDRGKSNLYYQQFSGFEGKVQFDLKDF